MLASRTTALAHSAAISAARQPRNSSFSTTAASLHGIQRLGVVGAGQMGLGIALVAARTAKVDVLLADNSEAQLAKGLKFAETLLAKEVQKGKLSQEDADAARSRLKSVKGIEAFGDVDIAIEAVSESLPLKEKIFASLADTLPAGAILASNTSSISLSKIAAACGPERASHCVGFHFFNPVPVMKLVELIPALQTSPEVLARARAFAEAMGKTVTVSQDTPGFVSNRLLMPFINEAIIALETGVASKEDIDTTLKLGMGHPMGPLTLADFIGLDTCLSIMEVLQRETGDTKYRPSVLLGRMVSAGWLGKKSGKGFYEY
ncbi:3-hydroxyacyl-CoA dehydrogenase [Leucosporidium creatinivorum]|uniref:3-hydroxyacyl-CoA dehydrogenase n=1 Tax=Leucosporidium creatinivorum TaxID=106004 RepID=A0A1Y2F4I4_9BASI|nr:3-hydroxyacyl-CoA dehydrogenase [Leucosporidium creatinivorum]